MKTLENAFLDKYPQNGKVIEKWTIATNSPFIWESMTKPNMAAFGEWLCNNGARSSAKTYCAQLKSILNLYSEELSLPKGWDKVLLIRGDTSEQIYLTDEELKRVIEYRPDTKIEAIVQQQFVLSALVGARHGDIVKLTEANIRDEYICYVSEKTHIKAQVPISNVAKRILKGNFQHNTVGYEKFAYKESVSDPTFNDTLRRICNLCDIDEEITLYRRGKTSTLPKWSFASSHLGRRTCATLLYLHGCDIYTISRILAHNSVEMTARRYIMTPIRELSKETMGYFSQFK